ncbi:unnamed protein product [Rotaria sordida]|uniref:Uncharacterized protein n=1 Tax=Rotaria sordida TaxID=392033 RepID=A0A815LJT1_9BILA|nr:unnamed protein product [Rotaria sordida]CAF1528790.1 unnamed protein product [Rotaria sordida]CAF1627411.1 unnamed protein product [Rotaria sordida]CAF4178414.1 unnamed protein product [Rotaria sordida]
MSIHTKKLTRKKFSIYQASSEIPSSIKVTTLNIIDDLEAKYNPLSIDPNKSKININSITIILASGQLLLTGFEEKYLIDVILKTLTKDIETILQEKI